MKKQEFITELRKHLSSLPKSEVDDIIRDQEEFISDAMASGRSEDQVIAGIGAPKTFAQTLVAQTHIEKAEGITKLLPKLRVTWKALIAFIAMAPLNILVLIPFLVILSILIGFWASLISFVFGLGSALLFFISNAGHASVGFEVHLATALMFAGVLGLCNLTVRFLVWMSKSFLIQTLNYLKWNLKVINRLGEESEI